MKNRRITWSSIFLMLVLSLSAFPGASPRASAQVSGLTFPETGKTVSGKFLDYWKSHGGLAQQGYPISDVMQEKSDIDGKTYTVQYFERAEFEMHPENAAPNDVLLTLLGAITYAEKYPSGADGQLPNTSEGSVLFKETGKRLGGPFLDYWKSHGGLAQQGYPISDPFAEKSATDGKTYTVQYFERAVFELHPENAAPNDVLLSLLGRFQYNKPQATPVPPTATVPAQPTTPPATPTSVPVDPNTTCSDIPASKSMVVTPNCGPGGTVFRFTGSGFRSGEKVGVYVTDPSQAVFGAPFQADATGEGIVSGISLNSASNFPAGVWAVTMEGVSSHFTAIGYFKITAKAATPAPPPGATAPPAACDTSHNQDGEATPSSGGPGTRIVFRGRGFRVGERVSFWFTTPDGDVVGTEAPEEGFVNPDGTIGPLPFTITPDLVAIGTGTWAITFQGEDSRHQSVIFFCVTP